MRINPYLSEWINLIARWIHVFVGILWIGQTYFFTWLDGRLSEEEAEIKNGEAAQLWMVHSGGFYVVEKQKVAELSRKLHWFRWEAAFTWLSGMVLLVLVYYMGGALIDPDVMDISVGKATAIGIGLFVVAWIVYDLLCLSPLVKQELLFDRRICVGGRRGVWIDARDERASGLHPRRGDVRNDHGRECLDANSAGTEKNDRSHARREDG